MNGYDDWGLEIALPWASGRVDGVILALKYRSEAGENIPGGSAG
jgi:hypothetical protein